MVEVTKDRAKKEEEERREKGEEEDRREKGGERNFVGTPATFRRKLQGTDSSLDITCFCGKI